MKKFKDYDGTYNLAIIEAAKMRTYKGATPTTGYRLRCYSLYDEGNLYHVSCYESYDEAYKAMMILSGGTWKEVKS